MVETKEMLVYGLLFALVFSFALIIHLSFKKNNVWQRVVKRYKDNTDRKLISEAEFVTRFGAMENKSLLYKLDRLTLTSGVRKVFRWFNGEALLIAILGTAAAGFLEGWFITGNIFVALFLLAAQGVTVYVIFKALSARNYNQIEDGISIFVSLLCNHAKGSSDIVTIMDSTVPSLTGPLRGITKKFVLDAETTGNVDIAFDFMKESVDSRQLQTIIVNLKNCMHYQANYEEVLVQMTGQIAAGLSAREDRKNILFSSKLTLVLISLMEIIIVLIIGGGLDIDVRRIMTQNSFGQGLLFATGVLYLGVFVKMFGTDR